MLIGLLLVTVIYYYGIEDLKNNSTPVEVKPSAAFDHTFRSRAVHALSRMLQQLIFTAAAAASLFCSTFASPVQSSPQVTTTSGVIIGHAASNRTGVTEFLGIKYGEAAVGELRFAAPKRYVAPAGTVYNASEWVSCMCTVYQ